MPKSGKKGRSTALFDIRVHSLDHNVVVIKGTESDANSVLLSGVIVLSVTEPLPIRKLGLKMYATLRLKWVDTYQTAKGPVNRPVRFEKKVFEFNWDALNLTEYFKNLYENYSVSGSTANLPGLNTGGHSNSSSSSSLKDYRTKSASNLASLASSFTNSSSQQKDHHVLAQGNYEFPFSTILAGSIPESIEGLSGCSLVYKLEASIERGRFSPPLITKKHIRVVRTMTTDAVELSETIAVDNTWPQKVDYSISIPSRAVAIGSGTRIDLLLVPLLKGLKLGNVKVSLAEYYSFCFPTGAKSGEKVVCETVVRKPSKTHPRGMEMWKDMTPDVDGVFFRNEDMALTMDKWEISAFLPIPASLAKCTQDCDIESHVKVRHKLKFVIGLINPDGHVSELRATLPITLFISPFVSVSAGNVPEEEPNYRNEDVSVPDNDEDVLFERSTTPGETRENPAAASLTAPPNYANHVYDRLYSGVASPEDTPAVSTPEVPGTAGESDPRFGNQLLENLRQLHLQREGNKNVSSMDEMASSSATPQPRRRPVFSLPDENEDYFSYKNTTGPSMTTGDTMPTTNSPPPNLMSPGGASAPYEHLSRTGSSVDLDGTVLSRVPSYTTAMKSGAEAGFTPLYSPPLPGSHIDLHQLNKRLESQTPPAVESGSRSGSRPNSRPGSKPGSRNQSSANLKSGQQLSADLAKSRGSSTNTSPSASRNQSFKDLIRAGSPSPPQAVRSPTKGIHAVLEHEQRPKPAKVPSSGSIHSTESNSSHTKGKLKKVTRPLSARSHSLLSLSKSATNLVSMSRLHKERK